MSAVSSSNAPKYVSNLGDNAFVDTITKWRNYILKPVANDEEPGITNIAKSVFLLFASPVVTTSLSALSAGEDFAKGLIKIVHPQYKTSDAVKQVALGALKAGMFVTGVSLVGNAIFDTTITLSGKDLGQYVVDLNERLDNFVLSSIPTR